MTDNPQILFARLDVEKTMEKVNELMESKKPKEEKPEEPVMDIEPKEEISYDDFMKMQFQVGEIIACQEVKSPRSSCAPR